MDFQSYSVAQFFITLGELSNSNRGFEVYYITISI